MNIYDVIKKPIISEKAEDLRNRNIYAFEVNKKAHRDEVKAAIEKIYGVKPEKVNILNVRAKAKSNRFGIGYKSSRKKAYVFLNKKDKIEILEGV